MGIDLWEEHADDDAFWLTARFSDPLRQADSAKPNPTGMTIEDGLAWARSFSDEVTVKLDDQYYAAGVLVGEDERPWPPADLDLRPRWSHEPANSARAAAWWVELGFYEDLLLPKDEVIALVGAHADVIDTRVVTPYASERLTIECLLRSESERSPISVASGVAEAYVDATAPYREPPRAPAFIRRAVLLDRLLRRKRQHGWLVMKAARSGVRTTILRPGELPPAAQSG